MKLADPHPVVTRYPRRPLAYISSDPHRWPSWFIPVVCWVVLPALAWGCILAYRAIAAR